MLAPEESTAFDGASPALERLAAAALSISSHLELAAVLRDLVDAAAELAGARYAAVGVFAEDRRTLREFITVGLSDEEIAHIGSLPTGRGVLGTLVHHDEPLRIADVSRHPDSVGVPPGHPPMRSFLGMSIRAGGEVFGRIYLTEKRGGGEFTAEDEGLVSLIAAHAGVAVENARLYEQAQQRVRELEALNEVALALAGQDDPSAVLHSVAEAGRRLGGGGAAVVVVPDADALRIAGADGPSQAEVWRLFRSARQVASQTLADPAPDPQPGVHDAAGDSFAAVALVAAGRVLGVLVVALPEEGLSDPRRRALATLASLAASSLRLAGEFRTAVVAERRTRALFEVARVALGGGPLREIVTAATERVLQLQKAAAAVVLWGVDGSLDVIAAAGDAEVPEGLSGPADLPGFDWVPIPGDEERHGWLGVRLSGGDELTPERREQLEGWAGVISLAHRAERLRIMRRQVLVAEERSRIAMELHDGAVQRLFGVGMALQGASLRVGDGDARLATALASAVDEIDSAISEIRAYVHDLRPSGLEPATVHQLISDDVGMLSAFGITHLHVDDTVLAALGGDAGAELVQVLAEACANMARHAHASHAEIRVERRRGRLLVSVGDDGVGFDPTARSSGHGLKNLRERAARLDGELHIDSAPGKGTRLQLEVPL